jgi:hypothetical protein
VSKFVGNIFAPVVQFLDKSINQLTALGTLSAKGVRLDHYFGVFGVLGPEWARVISTFLGCLMFIFILYTIQKYSGVLLWFKDLIKWW